MQKFLWFSLLFIGSISAIAQNKSVTQQDNIWLRYMNQFHISDKVKLVSELEMRRMANPDRSHQLLPGRFTLLYALSDRWSAGAGMVYFLQYLPQDPQLEVDLIRPEIRPHQDVIYQVKKDRFKLLQRARLEQRMLRNVSKGQLVDGYQLIMRLRYLLQGSYDIVKRDKSTLSLLVNSEIMFHAGTGITTNYFDQNRFSAGALFTYQNFGLEVVYMNWYQQRNANLEYYNRDILRVTVHQTIK